VSRRDGGTHPLLPLPGLNLLPQRESVAFAAGRRAGGAPHLDRSPHAGGTGPAGAPGRRRRGPPVPAQRPVPRTGPGGAVPRRGGSAGPPGAGAKAAPPPHRDRRPPGRGGLRPRGPGGAAGRRVSDRPRRPGAPPPEPRVPRGRAHRLRGRLGARGQPRFGGRRLRRGWRSPRRRSLPAPRARTGGRHASSSFSGSTSRGCRDRIRSMRRFLPFTDPMRTAPTRRPSRRNSFR
jgi:hypothetical protein